MNLKHNKNLVQLVVMGYVTFLLFLCSYFNVILCVTYKGSTFFHTTNKREINSSTYAKKMFVHCNECISSNKSNFIIPILKGSAVFFNIQSTSFLIAFIIQESFPSIYFQNDHYPHPTGTGSETAPVR